MTLQVLISTMHQTDVSLLERMNIRSDAIVINQSNTNCVTDLVFRGHKIKWITCNERGVGLSRNTALMRADADIVLFADDDVVFQDDYESLVISEFQQNPNAALIVFNIKCLNEDRFEKEVRKNHRIRFYSSLSYGAYRFAAKRNVLMHNRIFFSQLFGGGCLYSAGEDNIFLNDLLSKHLYCMASSTNVGIVTHNESTWFEGFTEKYFFDLGHLMYSIFKLWAPFLAAVMLIKNRKIYKNKLKMKTMRSIVIGMLEERQLERGRVN